MSNQVQAPDTGRLDLFFQLTKVDLNRRQVAGRATEESPDKVREIMDYATSVPNFKAWSAAAYERTSKVDGLPDSARSLGNMRRMHQPIAAGKVIDIQYNDAAKAIDINTYVSDDETWKMILDGTLTGFSIGGTAKRWMDPRNPSYRRYTAEPEEISYVDSPAHPKATFALIKADGLEELHKIGDPLLGPLTEADKNPAVNPGLGTNPVENTTAPDLVVLKANEDSSPIGSVAGGLIAPDGINDGQRKVSPIDHPLDNIDGAKKILEGFENVVSKLDGFTNAVNRLADITQAAAGQPNKAEINLKAIGSRVGIARRDSEPLMPPKDYPTDPNQYGDPANWSWPLDKARTPSAIASFNAGSDRDKYNDREWNILGRRIAVRATKLFGAQHQYSPTQKLITSKDTKMKQIDLAKVDVMPLMAQVRAVLDEASDQLGNDPDAMRDLLMNLVGQVDSQAATGSVDTGTKAPTLPTNQQGMSDATLKGTGSSTPPTPPSSPSSPTSSTITTVPTPTLTSTDKAAAPDTPSSSSSSSSSPATTTATTTDAKLDKMIELLTKVVEGNVPAVMQKAMPIGDLAALLEKAEAPKDPVLEALTSGGQNALLKAAQIAGTEDRPDFQAVYEKAHQQALKEGQNAFTRLMMSKGIGPAFIPSMPAGS